MFYMETTIVLEENGPHHWKLPVTKADINQEITLMTDTSSFILTPTISFYPSGVSKATLSPSSPRTGSGSVSNRKLTSATDLVSSIHSASTSLRPTFLPLVTPTSPPESPDRENTKVILGSILGGVLGFAIVAIAIFCLLNYFGDRRKTVGRRRKKRYCMFKRSATGRGGKTMSKTQYRHFPGELEENGGSTYDQGINPLDYVHIPVNSTMLPYEPSPFYSDDLLRFKPIDPNNSFKQQQHGLSLIPVKSNLTINSEQIPSPKPEATHATAEIPTHQSLQTRRKPPSIAVKPLSRHVSTSSSSYSPRSNQGSWPSSPLSPLPEHTIIELRGLNSPYFQVLSKDPLGDKSIRSSLNMPKSPVYANASHRRQLLKTFKPQQGLECALYDDGRGKYPEIQFGEALKMTDVGKPEIPPQASSERRNMALRRIKELSWSGMRLADESRKSSVHGVSKHSIPSKPIRKASNTPTNELTSDVSGLVHSGLSGRIINRTPSRIPNRTPSGVPSHINRISNLTSNRSGAHNRILTEFDSTSYQFPNRIPAHTLGGIRSAASSRSSSDLPKGAASHPLSSSTNRDAIRIPSDSSNNSKYGPIRVPSNMTSPNNDELYDDYILFSNAYVSYEHKHEDTK